MSWKSQETVMTFRFQEGIRALGIGSLPATHIKHISSELVSYIIYLAGIISLLHA